MKYLKTDRQTDRQGRLLWTPSGKLGVQNIFVSQAWYIPLKSTFQAIKIEKEIEEGQLGILPLSSGTYDNVSIIERKWSKIYILKPHVIRLF